MIDTPSAYAWIGEANTYEFSSDNSWIDAGACALPVIDVRFAAKNTEKKITINERVIPI